MTNELEQIKEAFAGLIKICEEVADFKNGVEYQGVDEGECVAGIYIVAAKDALAALEACEARLESYEWQPIETAPKDGAEILITASGEVYAASWKCGEWRPIDQNNYYSEWDGFKEGVIIKWQHLPQPPKEQSDA